jgi:hypothetical protein
VRAWLRRLGAEAGQISIVRTLVTLAIAGVLLFEGGAIIVNRIQAVDSAVAAARDASATYAVSGGDEDLAKSRAVDDVRAGGAEFISFLVDTSSRRVYVSASKTAHTLLVHRIEWTKGLAQARVTQSAPFQKK